MTTTESESPTGSGSPGPAPIGQLAAALAKFQGEMPSVEKKNTAKVVMKNGGDYSYSYASLADVTLAAMPILAKHGLSFICLPEEADRGYTLRGILAHESGETMEGRLPLHGNSNQELGASLTYGRRYLLGALTGIVTDNDVDGQGAGSERTKNAAPPANKQVEQGPPVAADDAWVDKIADAATFDDLTAVYNEADQLGILGHMLGNDTVKASLYTKRRALAPEVAE